MFVVVTAAVLASVGLQRLVTLHVGEVAPYTVTAPHTFVDQPATAAAQEAAAARVSPVYDIDPNVTQADLAAFDTDLQLVIEARQALRRRPPASAGTAPSVPSHVKGAPARATATAPSVTQEVATLRGALGLPVPAADYRLALTAPAASFDGLAGAARATLQALLSRGVRLTALAAARADVQADIGSLPGGAGLAAFLGALDAHVLTANDFLNGPATDAAVAMAKASVRPVLVVAGQVIVRQGDRVTPLDVALLRAAGMLRPGGRLGVLATSLLIAAAEAALCWAYFTRLRPEAVEAGGEWPLFVSLFCASAAAVRLSAPISPYLAPVGWAAILSAVALGPGAAVFTAALGGFTAGLLDHSLAVALAATSSSWTAVFVLRRAQQRADLVRAGLYAGLAGAAAVALVRMFGGQETTTAGVLASTPPSLWRDVIAAAVSGPLSSALAVGTLPYAEVLGVLTPFRLLELANPTQPLLRRLMLEAPGTYHHSLMVANLAEAACQTIGADALLVRVGAYYHDVGKLRRPLFFIENQLGGPNPHDLLSPWLSAQVIKSHVADGVALARQARLPEPLVDFIRSHHGTTLIRYFYQRAQAAPRPGGESAAVNPADFRYEGPVPETREAGVLMLADSVEAAVRSKGRPSASTIQETIESLVAARLAEGQLERTALTLRDIDQIKATFARILAGVYHARVEYPADLVRAVTGGAPAPGPPVAG
jgi:putative nucleotidyltransferase with HDIG domain